MARRVSAQRHAQRGGQNFHNFCQNARYERTCITYSSWPPTHAPSWHSDGPSLAEDLRGAFLDALEDLVAALEELRRRVA